MMSCPGPMKPRSFSWPMMHFSRTRKVASAIRASGLPGRPQPDDRTPDLEGAVAVFWRRILRRPKPAEAPRFRTAPGDRIYAIGDVHGRADLLTAVLQAVDADIALHPDRRCHTVLLGDYVDRGPESRSVIETLSKRTLTGGTVCLMGNHEAMLLGFLRDPESW